MGTERSNKDTFQLEGGGASRGRNLEMGELREMFWGEQVSHIRTWVCVEGTGRLESYVGALCLW